MNIIKHFASEFFNTEEGRKQRELASFVLSVQAKQVEATSNCGRELCSAVEAASEFMLAVRLGFDAVPLFLKAMQKQCEGIRIKHAARDQYNARKEQQA